MKRNAIPEEKKSKLILSSFGLESALDVDKPVGSFECCAVARATAADSPSPLLGIIFLKKIFCETKTTVLPNAQIRPSALDIVNSAEDASMTPRVSGSSDTYVAGEYDTLNSKAYVMTVHSGVKAYRDLTSASKACSVSQT